MNAEIFFSVFFVIFAHWVADFVAQKSSWAENKSHDIEALTKHVLTYGAIMFVFMLYLTDYLFIFGAQHTWTTPLFIAIQTLAHFLVDYFTSKLNTRLYKAGLTHNFFVSIGLDQVIHYGFLILFMYLMYVQ